MNLNLENIDTAPIIKLTLEKGMFEPLVYTCTSGNNPEFMFPLTRLWSLYL